MKKQNDTGPSLDRDPRMDKQGVHRVNWDCSEGNVLVVEQNDKIASILYCAL